MNIISYCKYIYKMRYFWVYLARCDLVSKYRRSKLGMLWVVLSPLLLTFIMSFVLGTVFNMPIVEYVPYILIGMVMWDLIISSVLTGGGTFMAAYPYIRQFNHPVTIYTLKSTVVFMINFLISTVGVIIWVLFYAPENIIIGIISMPLNTILLFFLTWSITTISAYMNTKYRDFPQMMTLIMQAIWYISPVFFQEEMFTSNPMLYNFFLINPITHLLYLMRKPFLYGCFPDLTDYLFALGSILFFAAIALLLNKKYSKKVIFYL